MMKNVGQIIIVSCGYDLLKLLGVSRNQVETSEPLPTTTQTLNSLFSAAEASTLSGIGALSAYESQIPVVAESKLAGLAAHYGISEERSTEFFRLHSVMDKGHSNTWWSIVEAKVTSSEAQISTEEGARIGRDALWSFLDGICREYFPEALAAC